MNSEPKRIDYAYVHNKSCELLRWLEGFLRSDYSREGIHEQIRSAMQDIAFHSADDPAYLEMKTENAELKRDVKILQGEKEIEYAENADLKKEVERLTIDSVAKEKLLAELTRQLDTMKEAWRMIRDASSRRYGMEQIDDNEAELFLKADATCQKEDRPNEQ